MDFQDMLLFLQKLPTVRQRASVLADGSSLQQAGGADARRRRVGAARRERSTQPTLLCPASVHPQADWTEAQLEVVLSRAFVLRSSKPSAAP